MGRSTPARQLVDVVDRDSGEIKQLELPLSHTPSPEPPARYDWRPHTGRHVNVPKTLLRKVWHKDSGYTQNDRDIFGFYLGHSPEGTEPLRMTFKEVGETIGMRPDSVAKSVEKLHRGGLLLHAETVGRMKFFRLNVRAGYDGSASEQNEATRECRFPEVPAPKKAPAAKTTKTKREAS